MKLDRLARFIGARIVIPGADPHHQIRWVYAGDRISDLLNATADEVLLVSNLQGSQLLKMADLIDLPSICLVGGAMPDLEPFNSAAPGRVTVLVSPFDLFETCGRLFRCLRPS